MMALAGTTPAVVATLFATRAARSADKVLKVVLVSDLKGIDPVFNTATYAAYHGYLVYDQLFALDSKGKPQPQMVDTWEVSADRKTWKFRLRGGLKFHDSSPVRAADATASILRWKDRDVVGKALFSAGAKLEAVDDLTFTLALSDPFGLVLDALAKPLSNALFVMPEAVAKTPATAQISSAVGSGPFIFVKEEWRPGAKAVYVRNPHYVPRQEKPDGLAGAKVAKVDRVEWLSIPDANTAISALTAGEIDYLQNPAMDTYPVLKADKKVRFVTVDPTGSMVWIRPNHLQPPFDNPKARQALLHVIDQTAILQALGAPAETARPFCGSFFMCGTPLETSAGTAGLDKPDLEKARALLKESGYDGRPVVFMQPSDLAANFNATVVVAEAMRKAGFKVDIQPLDWGTLSTRRNNKGPVDKGGWNLFITVATALDASTPLTNPYLATPCPNDVAGFPCDEELQRLRRSWWESTDEAERAKLADQIQVRAYQVVPYINGGQWKQYTAVRTNVSGLGETTVPVFWEVAKEG
ncbi:peptide/nickel transport system substrate-binding protein [Rhodospirillales bacterium URHD0017]|nr:peptide/nickel transport system substrate-binding protein [Rhodospirillales bacterium URHD0017]